MALAARGLAGDEEVSHFLIARHAFEQPSLFLSLAGRPLVTLMLALPAQVGLIGARLASVLASAACAYAVARTARSSGLGPPWLAVLFLSVQPFFLAHAGTAMTEPWAAALFAWMLLALVEERHRLLIVLTAMLPLARMEALVFWPIVAAYEWKYAARSWLALLPLPVFGLALVGAISSHDPLWLLHQSRWTAYPEREALHYVKSWVWTLGLGLFAPALLGLFGALYWAGRSESEMQAATRRALIGSAIATVVLLIVYSALAAWRPVTFGNLRYIAYAAPAVAILAMWGIHEIARGTLRRYHWIALALTFLAAALVWNHPFIRDFSMMKRRDVLPPVMAAAWVLLALASRARPRPRFAIVIGVILAAMNLGDVTLRHPGTLHLTDLPEHEAVRKAAGILPHDFPPGVRLYAAHPLMAWERGLNPYDAADWPPVTAELAQSAPPGTILFWDTHYVAGKALILDLRAMLDSHAWKYAGGVVARDSSFAGAFFVRSGPGEEVWNRRLGSALPPNAWFEAARLVQYGIASGRQNVAEDPTNAEMWRVLALRYQTAGYPLQAGSALAKAASLEPRNPQNHAYAAEMHRTLKEYGAARKEAQAALALKPANPRYEYLLGRILLDAGDVESAAPHLSAAARAMGKQPDMQLDAGAALGQLERWGEARPFLTRAAVLRPNDPRPVIGLMRVDVGLGHSDDAVLRAREFISRRPEIAETYVELGDLLVTLGRASEARTVWQDGLQKTNNPEIAARLSQLTP
jgi:tetratricopeptide (TPR) repeat protein